jgi:hypothetical protein
MSEPVCFTCRECGAQGDPPKCDHFMQPWTLDEIAEAHKKLTAAGLLGDPEGPQPRTVKVVTPDGAFDGEFPAAPAAAPPDQER